jgi:Flp pilus assembly protein TadG
MGLDMLNKPGLPPVSERVTKKFSDFRSDERGGIAIFIVFIFVFMLVFGGIAIDYMRFEIRRVALQQTMDRAALAAASLTQEETPQTVAEDYFAKAELDDDLKMVEFSDPTVKVLEGRNNESRSVRVTASVRSKNYFMGTFFMPVDYLEGPAITEAQQGAQKIEVMMVLDVTGSMGETPSGDTKKKIDGLKDAAKSFIELTEESDTLNQVSIGIVPYNTQVNLGAALRNQFVNATNIPTFGGIIQNIPSSNCLETPTTTAAFNSTSISITGSFPMSVFADLESSSGSGSVTLANGAPVTPTNGGAGSNYMCPPYAYSEVLLPTKESAPLLAKIASLQPNGRTSILMGMRWGVALLDESAKPIYEKLLAGEPAMAGRPAANTDPKTRKMIILMTDGNHVETKFIKDPYKTGPSPIYRSPGDGNLSIKLRDNGTNQYWVPHLCGSTNGCANGWKPAPYSNTAAAAKQLDWSEVWQLARVTWVARQLYARSESNSTTSTNLYNSKLAEFRGNVYVAKNTMDSLLQTNCNAAKAAGIEVFGIAFGAGADGEKQIKGCASSQGSDPNDKTGYFFKPQTADELEEAFKDIFDVMSPLKLTE